MNGYSLKAEENSHDDTNVMTNLIIMHETKV